jgi:hypothetical protein
MTIVKNKNVTIATESGETLDINSEGQAHVVMRGAVDAGNSSSTPLGISGAFLGLSKNTLDYAVLNVFVYSDVASATDGLCMQVSPDGIDWYDSDCYTVPAATPKTYSFQPQAEYYRMTYTNGAVAQSDFHLQTTVKKTYIKPSSHRIQDSIIDDDDGELVKAVITGKNPAEIYVNFTSTTAGNFKMSLEEFESTAFNQFPLPVADNMLEIPRGNRTGQSSVNKYGLARDGIQTTSTDIWDRADSTPTQQIWIAPTTARIHAIQSGNTADDGTPEGAGAGAQAVRIYGLTSWSTAEVSEDVILNGTTPVNTVNSYVIIHRMKIIPVGSTYNNNVGDITATAATDGTVTAQINSGQGQTNMAIYGVPSTQTAYMTQYTIGAHNTGNPTTVMECDFEMLINEHPDLNLTDFINKHNKGLIVTGSSHVTHEFKPYLKIPGPAIIKFQAITTLADTEGSADFDLILVNN